MERIIDTKVGKIKGYIKDNNRCEFNGIPYAITERFELPKPYIIDGIYDTSNPILDCVQYGTFRDNSEEFYEKEFRGGLTFNYVESPMTLSITTPLEPKKSSVLIFIHGGGFENGMVNEYPWGYDSEYAKRNIILVSIGYRLNVLSLYRNLNLGLHDQLFAIKWVYDNIEAFGGNKNNMTLMGQSAGAMSITDLLYTKKLDGIIKSAIMVSGGGVIPGLLGPLSKDKFAPFWDDVDKMAGINNEDDRKNVKIDVLWNAWYERSRNKYGFRTVQPGIDGEIIKDKPQKLLKNREELDIPIMLGVTSQDFIAPIIYHLALNWAKDNDKKKKSNVYCYFFDRCLPGNLYKAFHAADLWYLFGNMDKSWRPFEDIDYKLKDTMIDYVVNFINNHDPNGDGLKEWKPTTRKFKNFKYFSGSDSDSYIKPSKAKKMVWRTMLKDHGPM